MDEQARTIIAPGVFVLIPHEPLTVTGGDALDRTLLLAHQPGAPAITRSRTGFAGVPTHTLPAGRSLNTDERAPTTVH